VKLSLGCIADDYTGASDLANTLTRQGLRTVQTIGVPSDDLALPDVDAVVVSLKSRSTEAGQAVARSRATEKWLRGRGAGHVAVVPDPLDGSDRALDFVLSGRCEGGSPGGEYLHQINGARVPLHWFVIQERDVSNDTTRAI